MANNSVVTQEKLQEFYDTKIYDYLNGATHTGCVPLGTILPYFGETAPTHFLICDGTEYAKTDYPELAEHLLALTDPTPYAGSDEDHFKVPDLRGEFLRGTGTNSHTNQGSGSTVGTHQNATTVPYTIQISPNKLRYYAPEDASEYSYVQNSDYSNKTTCDLVEATTSVVVDSYPSITSTVNIRPTNTSVTYIIAYRNAYIDLALDSFPIDISNPTDGQLLMYDATAGRWVNGGGVMHEYSTEEHVVATWVDNKPIYEKTIINATLPSVSNWALLDDSVSYDKLFKCEYCIGSTFNGYWENNDSQSVPRFSVQQSGDLQNKLCYYTDNTISSCIIIIQYTKTTDTV